MLSFIGFRRSYNHYIEIMADLDAGWNYHYLLSASPLSTLEASSAKSYCGSHRGEK
jgi:hypothetical protein